MKKFRMKYPPKKLDYAKMNNFYQYESFSGTSLKSILDFFKEKIVNDTKLDPNEKQKIITKYLRNAENIIFYSSHIYYRYTTDSYDSEVTVTFTFPLLKSQIDKLEEKYLEELDKYKKWEINNKDNIKNYKEKEEKKKETRANKYKEAAKKQKEKQIQEAIKLLKKEGIDKI